MLGQRLTAQMLAGPQAGAPEDAVRHLLAVQAQDARGMRLAVRARVARPDRAAFESALNDRRSLVVTWLCRGTLHLVAAEDLGWLHALATPPLHTGNARRLAQESVSPGDADRAVAEIERALGEEGPLTRAQLGERVARLGVRTEGQALVHLLCLATLRGVAVRGPVLGAQHAYVLVRDWLGPGALRPPAHRESALAELARRYLAAHAPATERDLARWAGLPLRDARAGLAAIAGELGQDQAGLVTLRPRRASGPAPRTPRPPAARMLGPWDPLLVGWGDRSFVLGRHDARVVSGGLFRPFVLAGGRTVGTWAMRGGEVELGEPFEPVSGREAAAIRAEAESVARYLGGSVRA